MSKRGIGFLIVLALLSMLFVSAMASAQDGEQGPLQPWEIVQKSDGGYNVIALHEEMGEGIRKHVHELLIQEFGDKVLHWTVLILLDSVGGFEAGTGRRDEQVVQPVVMVDKAI